VHLRGAGNPHRDKRKNIELCLSLYRQHLAKTPEVLQLVQECIEGQQAALCGSRIAVLPPLDLSRAP
jgi:hypothetical protein